MPSIHEITSGTDITDHYLDGTNKKFKIYRYNQNVYAVRYDQHHLNPIDFIPLWRSHKGEDKDKPQFLGTGEYGDVYQKTTDKVFKFFKKDNKYRGDELQKNLDILEQLFVLQENHIAKYFILGLWNIKNKDDVFFNMPKVDSTRPKNFNQEMLKQMYEELTIGLKKLNELGYSHPDIANGPYHFSPQNMLITTEGIKCIDLDSGFYPNSKTEHPVYGRDQWIYTYNHKYPPNDDREQWKIELDNWYKENPEKSLSDNPGILLSFYNNEYISLPISVVNEIHLSNSNETVLEYRSGSKKNRKHSFHEVSTDDFRQAVHKEEYKGITGDALKRTILKELKDSLATVKTLAELEDIKSTFLKSPQMQILKSAQDKPTDLFSIKTGSRQAVKKIFKAAEERISKSPTIKF